jgi:hypothetical protein
VPAVWPWLDAACTPPPLDARAESSVPLTDAGASTVTPLPDGGDARGLAVDDTTVYWTDSVLDSVWSAPLAGGRPQVVADVGTPGPTAIAVDDSFVFWISSAGQRILRCPKGATNCTPFVVLAPFEMSTLALDALNVYTIAGSSVLACPKTGCRNAPVVVASGIGSPYDIAVQGDTLFMLDYPPDPGSTSAPTYAAVVKCPVTGCGSPPTVLAWDENPSGLATDGRYVYWISETLAGQPTSIKRCAVCGCGGTPEVILPASAAVTTYNVWTDGVHLFFIDQLPSLPWSFRLLACSVDGCGSAPTQLLTGLPNWNELALGPGRVVLASQTQILIVP